MAKAIKWPDYNCNRCGTDDRWEICRCINAGGHVTHLFVCGSCGERTTHFVPNKDVIAAGIAVGEIEPVEPHHKCEVCGAKGAENHHWAPWALFGSEAQSWPQSYLCPRCHKRWHDTVTPTISTQRGL